MTTTHISNRPNLVAMQGKVTHTPLSIYIENTIRHYFAELQDELPKDLYNLIIKEIEKPMLKVVLEVTRGNQSKSAEVLGLSRGTLRKKMATYDML